MKKLLVLGLLILIAGSAPAAYLEQKITALEVRGNLHASDQEVLGEVFSKVGEKLEQEKIKNDLKAIYALGYFQDAYASFEAFRDGTRIIYNVVENPPVEAITVEGNTVLKSREIIDLMDQKVGKIMNYKTMRADLEKLGEYYRKQGYTLARVTDVQFEKDQGILSYKIVEGIVESVSLEGNDVTQDNVILREMRLKPGGVFNEEVLSKDLRRIFNLGFFSEINPAFEPGSTSEKIRLILKMKETRTNSINFGGGYGEREGWFGFVDLSINNLAGTARGLLMRGQWGQQLTTYQLRYYDPWFLPDRLGERTSFTGRVWNTMGTDIYLTQQDEWHEGWDVAFGKTLRDEFSSSFSLGSESVSPRGGATFEAYNSDFIGLSFSYDTRDFWMNPTRGLYHTLSLKQGWKFASSSTNYFKLGLDFNAFIPLADKQVLAQHVGFGAGFGDVPLGELYWSGGPNTVRGYSLSEIRRGVRKLIANIEYRYTFNEIFQGVFFFDWGNAWDVGAPVPTDFMSGWGPGVRLNTPLGPIRLDYGVASARNFGEGILHFSIGQAF